MLACLHHCCLLVYQVYVIAKDVPLTYWTNLDARAEVKSRVLSFGQPRSSLLEVRLIRAEPAENE